MAWIWTRYVPYCTIQTKWARRSCCIWARFQADHLACAHFRGKSSPIWRDVGSLVSFFLNFDGLKLVWLPIFGGMLDEPGPLLTVLFEAPTAVWGIASHVGDYHCIHSNDWRIEQIDSWPPNRPCFSFASNPNGWTCPVCRQVQLEIATAQVVWLDLIHGRYVKVLSRLCRMSIPLLNFKIHRCRIQYKWDATDY